MKCLSTSASLFVSLAMLHHAQALELKKGDHVCIVGNTFAERLQHNGYFETLLHARHASEEVVVRNLSWSADTLTLRPRPLDCPSQDAYLTKYAATVIIACYGLNESYETPLATFRKDLSAFIDHTLAEKYDGLSTPRLVLISPVAHEDIKSPHLPSAIARNAIIQKYVSVMADVAGEKQVEFVDIFTPLLAAYQETPVRRLTDNGIHLNDDGQKYVASLMDAALFGDAGSRKNEWPVDRRELLRKAVNEKNLQFWYRHRPINPFYIYGGRAAPFGTVSFPPEMERLDGMVLNRERKVWHIAQGKTKDLIVDDNNLKEIAPIPSVLKDESPALSPEEEMKTFTMLDGFEVNLFASEVEFPELQKPVQLTFDAKGRMWVSTIPTYPHLFPGQTPQDRVLILTDKDHDGKADECKTFAKNLYIPIGLELGYGGAYVSAEPDLLYLKDTDGDDVADIAEKVLHGFGTEDSHHAISAFAWGPGGGLHMMEGTFHHTQVETPWGPTRLVNAGILRFEPLTQKLAVYSTYGYANPWGQTWDRWGRNYIADASGGDNHYGNAYTGYLPYPEKHAFMERFTPKEAHVRPTSGCEVVSSRQFPDEYQQWWLLNNNIGFQGTRMFHVVDDGSGFKATLWKDLIVSNHANFRPVDLEFGPDGALYIVDWYNPIIGHMQYSLRDPKRDKAHGRIWRITAKGRAKVEPAKIDNVKIPDLLALLRTYEDRTRYRVRRELAQMDTVRVLVEMDNFLTGLAADDPEREHLQLECLWIQQHHNSVQAKLLKTVLAAKEPKARAAAVHVLRTWHDRVPDAVALLKSAANDESPVVRMEAVVAASHVQSLAGVEVALEAVKHPRDYYIDYALTETMRAVEKYWKEAVSSGKSFATDNSSGLSWLLSQFTNDEVLQVPKSPAVWHEILRREGMSAEHLKAAVKALADRGKSAVDVMIDALPNVKGTGLANLLANWTPDQLAPAAQTLTALATTTKSADVRAAATAALIATDGGDRAWKLATESPDAARALLSGVTMLNDSALRDKLQPVLASMIKELPAPLAARLHTAKPAHGRFVRIELPRRGTLSLTEVEVFSGGRNIARSGTATQSSTANGGVAARAIDAGTHGEWGRGTTTHTNEDENNPWWEVDLTETQPIERILIGNRTDAGLGKRLDGFTLTILDGQRKEVFMQTAIPAPNKIDVTIATDSTAALRAATVRAYATLPGREAEKYAAFLPLLNDPALRHEALTALNEIDSSKAPVEGLEKVGNELLAMLPKVDPGLRTQSWFTNSLALAKGIAGRVPRLTEKLEALLTVETPLPVTVKSVQANLFYDTKEIKARAGQIVALTFENAGEMPHNLIICAPNSLEKVGAAADAMQTQPGAMERGFIPDMPEVLHRVRLLQPREIDTLIFRLPEAPGDYIYLCTFPGHWRIMNGVLKVTK